MEQVAFTTLPAPASRLGEGPTYDRRTNTAWWFDILGCKLFEADLGTMAVCVHDLPRMASVLAVVDDERQLLAMQDGLYLREVASGRLTLFRPLEADNATTRSNDGRVHPSGALWVGTMGIKEETGAGSIYCLSRGVLHRLYGGITVPNAICFSPDGATAYFTDTPKGLLHRVAVDPATGLPVGEPATLFDHRGGEGWLDGAVVDVHGLIWNARWDGSCVDAYSPEGARLRTVAVPTRRPSCPAFVGLDLDRLLVTTAFDDLEAADASGNPHQGRTLLFDVGARGIPEPRLALG